MIWTVPAEWFYAYQIVGNVLLCSTGTNKRRALSAESGRVLWSVEGELWMWRDRLAMFEPDCVSLLNPADGRMVQKMPPLPHTFRTGRIGGGGVKAIDRDALLYEAEGETAFVAYDLSRATVLWERSLRAEIEQRLGHPATWLVVSVASPELLSVSIEGGLVGVSFRDGSILWDTPVEVPYYFHAASKSRIYVMVKASRHNAQGRPLDHPPPPYGLLCLDAASGETLYYVAQPALGVSDEPTRGVVHDEYIAFGCTAPVGIAGHFESVQRPFPCC